MRRDARPPAVRPLPEGALLRSPVPAGALEPGGGLAQGSLQGAPPPCRGSGSARGGRRVHVSAPVEMCCIVLAIPGDVI